MVMLAVVISGLETVFDRYLRLDPEFWLRLMPLDGKVIALTIDGMSQAVYLLIEAERIRILDRYHGEPSVSIRGSCWALLKAWQTADPGMASTLIIEGDTDVARQFQALMVGLDIDWEEQLSRSVGDVAAHTLGSLWRGVRRWGQQTSTTLSRNSTEYLQQELHALPSRHAVEQFLNAVDTLREDADRLMVRVERLRRHSIVGDSL
jgi:ubiquinone biosynthesis protein UbiJ